MLKGHDSNQRKVNKPGEGKSLDRMEAKSWFSSRWTVRGEGEEKRLIPRIGKEARRAARRANRKLIPQHLNHLGKHSTDEKGEHDVKKYDGE